jgi:hypothetical protein
MLIRFAFKPVGSAEFVPANTRDLAVYRQQFRENWLGILTGTVFDVQTRMATAKGSSSELPQPPI